MSLINPSDSIERQNVKLLQIAESLMRRVEQKNDQSGLAYQQFERAALLENRVRERTQELERALDLLQESNAGLERANREVEAGRENLNEAIETINEGFALFDAGGRLIQFNSRFCRWFDDITAKLSEGMLFEEYVHVISQSFFLSLPEGQTPREWAEHRLGFHSQSHFVLNVRLASNKWLQVSEHRTARGGTVILQTDVSEIMRLERNERDKMRDEQAQMLQATLDHLNQGICIFDEGMALVGWNKNMDGLLALPRRRAVHGLSFSEIVTLLGSELEFHEGFSLERLRQWSLRKTRKPISFEVTRNGLQTLRVFAQEMPNRGFVISFTDVTVEREAAAALSQMNERLERGVRDRTAELGVALAEAERANASKSRFVAAASHDLLQPLSAAKLFLSSISDRLSDADGLSILNRAENALVSVEQIIEALLDISKLDAGHAVFKMQPVRLEVIVQSLLDQMSPVAAEKGLTLNVRSSDVTVFSDPSYLRRILQNLIGNAVKYTTDGQVTVDVTRRDGFANVSVIDTGPGIPREDQKMIFQEFGRRERDAATPGLGLGLAIVERACLGMGHDLSLESAPGQGSTFAVDLPLATEAAVEERVSVTQLRPQARALEGIIIFVVENDDELRTAMTLMLEEQGAEVLSAASAQAATDLLIELELAPDILLFDYQLGDGPTGVDLWEAIRRDYGAIPGFIVSADRSTELQTACFHAGAPLLSKPVTKELLLREIGMLSI